tara:strand:+ start:516 stop:785 length:270 start_codon:yes stop_codon:yes gene_type:complete
MSQLEKENLEAHVDLCAARYQVLEEKLTAMATRMDRMENSIGQNSKMLTDMAVKIEKNAATNTKVIIGASGTVIAGLLSTIVVLLISMA